MGVKFNPFSSTLDVVDSPSGDFADVELNQGTAAAPSISFDGDPNTGIYSPGADQVAISTNGQGRLFVDASGDVGIGTASPGARLTIGTTTDAEDLNVLRVYRGGFVNHYAEFSGAGGGAIINSQNGAGGVIVFRGDGNERARITSTGTLMHLGAGNSTTPAVQFNGSAPVNSLVMDSSGRVGLGTSSPANDFHVLGTTGVRIQNSADTDALFLLTFDSNNPDFRLYDTNGSVTTKLVASGNSYFNGGNVGIGTQTPSTTLDVSGSINLTGNHTFSTTTTPMIAANAANSVLRFGTGSGGVERARIDSAGRLLVGTSSTSDACTQVLQGYYPGGSAEEAILKLQRGTASPGSTAALGIIQFASSAGRRAAEIYAQRDSGTWTDGSSHPGRLIFSTTADGASSPTERMRITSDAYVRLASGTGGIQFNGDTAAANALDDYEEGTWDFAITTAGGSVTMNSGFNVCSYTKIGRIVHVGGQVTVSSVSSPTGFIAVTLPFTPASLSESAEYNAGVITIGNSVSKNTNDFALLIQDNGEMRIYVADTTVLSSTNANAQQLQANSIISFQLTYVAA
jgi:hypothetical protein